MKVYLKPSDTNDVVVEKSVVLNEERIRKGNACKWTAECPYIGTVSCSECQANLTEEMGIGEAIQYWKKKEYLI